MTATILTNVFCLNFPIWAHIFGAIHVGLAYVSVFGQQFFVKFISAILLEGMTYRFLIEQVKAYFKTQQNQQSWLCLVIIDLERHAPD